MTRMLGRAGVRGLPQETRMDTAATTMNTLELRMGTFRVRGGIGMIFHLVYPPQALLFPEAPYLRSTTLETAVSLLVKAFTR